MGVLFFLFFLFFLVENIRLDITEVPGIQNTCES